VHRKREREKEEEKVLKEKKEKAPRVSSNKRGSCDVSYLYNTIFGRGLLNTFEAVLHSLYLCLKELAAQGVISIHGSQKEARNIE
jgi:hypothetical protein